MKKINIKKVDYIIYSKYFNLNKYINIKNNIILINNKIINIKKKFKKSN